MAVLNRRRVLGTLGALGGSSVVACQAVAQFGRTPETGGISGPADAVQPESRDWTYTPLDPAAVADRAYRIYPEGGCMYAVVGSVLQELAERVGEPFASFPYAMMRFGDGGVGGWGSLCGVVNGGSALCGLFHREQAKERREQLIAALCTWYEATPLPQYVPSKAEWAPDAAPSVAESLLCHVSVARWCGISGCGAYSQEKKERCRRLAADGARQAVELLNRAASEATFGHASLCSATAECVGCHGPQGQADAMGKMSCATCHQMGDAHP